VQLFGEVSTREADGEHGRLANGTLGENLDVFGEFFLIGECLDVTEELSTRDASEWVLDECLDVGVDVEVRRGLEMLNARLLVFILCIGHDQRQKDTKEVEADGGSKKTLKKLKGQTVEAKKTWRLSG